MSETEVYSSDNALRVAEARSARDHDLRIQQVMAEAGRTLTTDDRAVIKKGNERLRNGETNTSMTADQAAEWRAFRGDIIADEQAMAEWEQRGFVSGPPDDHHVTKPIDDDGRNRAHACEHGIGGRHTLNGAASACEVLKPNIEDYWLSPSDVPVGPSEVVTLVQGEWDASMDAIEDLMEEVPHRTHEGGGLAGVGPEYRATRAAMSAERYAPARLGEGGPDAQHDA